MHSMCQRMLNSNSFENHMKAIHKEASLKLTVEKEKNIQDKKYNKNIEKLQVNLSKKQDWRKEEGKMK